MKKMILIIMLFMSVSAFAKEGDVEVSINAGISTGTGFGLTYNISDNLRIKFASVYLGLSSKKHSYHNGYSIGGSLSYDVKKLSDKISSVYLFIGTNHIGTEKEIPIHVYGAGLGLRKFVDKKLFFELEFGYALYDFSKSPETDRDDTLTFITGSLNLGYQF